MGDPGAAQRLVLGGGNRAGLDLQRQPRVGQGHAAPGLLGGRVQQQGRAAVGPQRRRVQGQVRQHGERSPLGIGLQRDARHHRPALGVQNRQHGIARSFKDRARLREGRGVWHAMGIGKRIVHCNFLLQNAAGDFYSHGSIRK